MNRVLRGGSPHEVLSEGFGLSLTRKDLHTLSNLNWLNDEVSAHCPQAKICMNSFKPYSSVHMMHGYLTTMLVLLIEPFPP